jgi:hypothetical protein
MDMAVPHTGSERWTTAMHRSSSEECVGINGSDDDELIARCQGTIHSWQPWYNSKTPRQVAGYVADYNSGLSYATIKGAGEPAGVREAEGELQPWMRVMAAKPQTLLYAQATWCRRRTQERRWIS